MLIFDFLQKNSAISLLSRKNLGILLRKCNWPSLKHSQGYTLVSIIQNNVEIGFGY